MLRHNAKWHRLLNMISRWTIWTLVRKDHNRWVALKIFLIFTGKCLNFTSTHCVQSPVPLLLGSSVGTVKVREVPLTLTISSEWMLQLECCGWEGVKEFAGTSQPIDDSCYERVTPTVSGIVARYSAVQCSTVVNQRYTFIRRRQLEYPRLFIYWRPEIGSWWSQLSWDDSVWWLPSPITGRDTGVEARMWRPGAQHPHHHHACHHQQSLQL